MQSLLKKIPLYKNPTSIVVSVSGGIDSFAAVAIARKMYPEVPLILYHSYMAGMDWPQTPDVLNEALNKMKGLSLEMFQAVYGLKGTPTDSGAGMETTLLRVQDVLRDGPAAQVNGEINSLLEFATAARLGNPPTSKIRYCTSYFKTKVFEQFAKARRNELGPRSIHFSGERWAESPKRSTIEAWKFYDSLTLLPRNKEFPRGWRMLWARPCINLSLQEATALVLEAGLPIHPGYFLQGETVESLLEPGRDERGRARLSCVCCIFTRPYRLQQALTNAPEIVGPKVQAMKEFEDTTGKSWQQSGFLKNLLPKAEVSAPCEGEATLFKALQTQPTIPPVEENFQLQDDIFWSKKKRKAVHEAEPKTLALAM